MDHLLTFLTRPSPKSWTIYLPPPDHGSPEFPDPWTMDYQTSLSTQTMDHLTWCRQPWTTWPSDSVNRRTNTTENITFHCTTYMVGRKYCLNKKVLLRERKRHTARHVESPWGYLFWLGGTHLCWGGVTTLAWGEVPTLAGEYLPWPGSTHLGQGGTYLGWGIPTLVRGYLPWPGGNLPWPGSYPPCLGGYPPWPGYPKRMQAVKSNNWKKCLFRYYQFVRNESVTWIRQEPG